MKADINFDNREMAFQAELQCDKRQKTEKETGCVGEICYLKCRVCEMRAIIVRKKNNMNFGFTLKALRHPKMQHYYEQRFILQRTGDP